MASEMGTINEKQVQLQDTTPIEVVEDAQKKLRAGTALLASADSRRMEIFTQVAQEEEEERGGSSGLRGAAICKHYRAEEVVSRGSKEGQAARGRRLGKQATSRVAPGGASGGVKELAQRLEGQASVLAALTNSAVLREARLARREQRLNERERRFESDCRGRVALAHDGDNMLERHTKVLQAQRDKALELVGAVMRLLAEHQPRDAECELLGGRFWRRRRLQCQTWLRAWCSGISWPKSRLGWQRRSTCWWLVDRGCEGLAGGGANGSGDEEARFWRRHGRARLHRWLLLHR
jgi:hypothetical protein